MEPRYEQGEQGVPPTQPLDISVDATKDHPRYHNQEMKAFLEGDMCKKVARVVKDYCINRVVKQRDRRGHLLHPTVPAFDDFEKAFIEATDGKWTLQSLYNGLDADMWKSPGSFDLSHKMICSKIYINFVKMERGCEHCDLDLQKASEAIKAAYSLMDCDHVYEESKKTDISKLRRAGATIERINEELVKCRIVCHAHHAPRKAAVAVGVQREHPVTFLPEPRPYVSLEAALDDQRVIDFREWIADKMEGTPTISKGKKRKRLKNKSCAYHDVTYQNLEQTCLDTLCIHPTRLVEDAEAKWNDSHFARGQLLVRMFYNLLKLVTGVCRTCGCVALPEDAQPSLLRFFEIDHGIYAPRKLCCPAQCPTVFHLMDEIARVVTERDKRCFACFGGADVGERVVMCSLRCIACHRSGRLTKEEEDERASFEEASAKRRAEGNARGAAARSQIAAGRALVGLSADFKK